MSYSLLPSDSISKQSAPSRFSKRRIALLIGAICTISVVLGGHRSRRSLKKRQCTPEAWSAGRWVRRPIDIEGEIETVDQALSAIGLQQCASWLDREWMFALLPQARLPRKAAMSWSWDAGCDERPFDRGAIIQSLARDGGLLLIGDSTTEHQFFAFSCYLWPDVRFELDETNSEDERGQPRRRFRHHLYLSDQARAIYGDLSRPILSYVRSDLFYDRPEIAAIIGDPSAVTTDKTVQLYDEPFERVATYITDGSYRTIVAATGGHWTHAAFTTSYERVLDIYSKVIDRWLDDLERILKPDQQFWMRSYIAGHADCDLALKEERGPLTKPPPVADAFNWPYLPNQDSHLAFASSGSIDLRVCDQMGTFRCQAVSDVLRHTYDCLHIPMGVDILEGQVRFLSQNILNATM